MVGIRVSVRDAWGTKRLGTKKWGTKCLEDDYTMVQTCQADG